MNVKANFDIIYYLSHPRNQYNEQTSYEINTMLYLAELLSIYDGQNTRSWGYNFARNRYGAPMSVELENEINFLLSKGILNDSGEGYYHISDEIFANTILLQAKTSIFRTRTKYIDAAIDSLLTKSFPRVVSAIKNEPGISLMDTLDRTSTLLNDTLVKALYEDFGVLQSVIGDPEIELVVPASLWIDYLSSQTVQTGENNGK